jgi:hypothetical protein
MILVHRRSQAAAATHSIGSCSLSRDSLRDTPLIRLDWVGWAHPMNRFHAASKRRSVQSSRPRLHRRDPTFPPIKKLVHAIEDRRRREAQTASMLSVERP